MRFVFWQALAFKLGDGGFMRFFFVGFESQEVVGPALLSGHRHGPRARCSQRPLARMPALSRGDRGACTARRRHPHVLDTANTFLRTPLLRQGPDYQLTDAPGLGIEWNERFETMIEM